MRMMERARAGFARVLGPAAAIGALALAACAQTGMGGTAEPTAAAMPMDPLSAFVATAPPGARGMVVYPDGSRVPARITRSYLAASGRECRDVMLGSGRGERATLVCQGGPEAGGAWIVARPLLNGSGGSGGGYGGGSARL